MTPATSVHIPAVPAPAIADADESLATIFADPLTDATSRTGFAPVAESEIVDQFVRSAIPLGAHPSTVIDVPLCRLICRVPFASSEIGRASFGGRVRMSGEATAASQLMTCAE